MLIDTDILSAIMRKHPLALERARAYLTAYPQFSFSIITRYEILRGLMAKRAIKQLAQFNNFCAVNLILALTDGIIETAAAFYAELWQRGELISDAEFSLLQRQVSII